MLWISFDFVSGPYHFRSPLFADAIDLVFGGSVYCDVVAARCYQLDSRSEVNLRCGTFYLFILGRCRKHRCNFENVQNVWKPFGNPASMSLESTFNICSIVGVAFLAKVCNVVRSLDASSEQKNCLLE